MNIIYLITVLLIYILFMLMHKTEKKQNLIAWLAISAIILICYNIFLCVICTFLQILCTLKNLCICNTIVIVILSIILFRKKKVQKYHIKTFDILFSILLLILVVFVAYKQYEIPFNIKYRTTDGSSHYYFAQKFYENSTLLYKAPTNEMLGVSQPDFRLPGAYINEGILFKVFDGILSKTDLFILFDLFILYLSGILFYNLLKTHAKEDKKFHFIAAIFSILYMLGYQLNSMQYGYVYLSLALSIVIAFLLLMKNCEKDEIKDTITLPTLSLVSFGIFFSYAYFIPIIYISIIANIIVKSIRRKEKIISQGNIIKTLFLIINPLILGATYFIILPISKGNKTEISSIIVDGLIYKNYITNLLIFIPILITNIIILIKNRKKETKETQFSTILFILSILFAIILFIGTKIEKVSQYYFFKAYYIIWPLAIYNTYLALCNILENGYKMLKIITYIYISIYIIVILATTLIWKQNIGINDIFCDNQKQITETTQVFKNKELKILESIQDKIEEHNIYVLTPSTTGRIKWMSVLNKNEGIYLEHIYQEKFLIDTWVTERTQKYYFAYHRDYSIYDKTETYLNENSNEYKIVYNDEYAFMLERTNATK